MKTYKLYTTTNGNQAASCINEDGSSVSFLFDPVNTDYQAYLAWLAGSNLPIPVESTEGSANLDPLPADEPTK